MMDRIDIQLWMHAVDALKLINPPQAESSASVRARVIRARQLQKERFRDDGIYTNAAMNNRMIEKYCPLDDDCKEVLKQTIERMGLSARACMRIIRIARTIADLDESADISMFHISEAAGFRFLDKQQNGI